MSKARICEACKKIIPDDDNGEMLYSLDICEAEGYTANITAEKKLLLFLDDICLSCTEKIRAAILFIVKGQNKNERRKTRK